MSEPENVPWTVEQYQKNLDAALNRAACLLDEIAFLRTSESDRVAHLIAAAEVRGRIAERARIAACIRKHKVAVGNSPAGEMAARWTLDALREIVALIEGEKK